MATNYTTRPAGLPEWIERNKTQTVELQLYRGGSPVGISSGTITIYDNSHTAIVDGAVASVSGGTISYEITAATLPETMPLGEGWSIIWEMVVGGETIRVSRDAALVRRRLYPVISDIEIESEMDSMRDLRTQLGSLQSYIDKAFEQLCRQLMRGGKYPYLVLSSWELYDAHMALIMAKVFRDASIYNPVFQEQADYYDKSYKKFMEGLSLTYDYDESGHPDQSKQGQSGDPVIFLGGAPSAYRSVR